MIRAQEESRPVALSRFDLPDTQELMVHSCEDCACPVTDNHVDCPSLDVGQPDVTDDIGKWIRGREVVEVRVNPENQALFNPLGRGGVVVVNRPAHEIYASFQRPATFKEVRIAWPGDGSDADQISRQLRRLEMIHPAGQAPRLEFGAKQGVARTLTAWLHVTNACNLRCPYCYVAKSSEKMEEPVGNAAVEAVVRSAATHGFSGVKLKYAGGEASLNHHLMLRLHARAKELVASNGLRLQATLLSNGVRLPRALVDTLKDEGIKVMISLDGVGDQHDVQRPFPTGKPSFHLVERTIAQLIEQRHAPHLSITITNRNMRGVAERRPVRA